MMMTTDIVARMADALVDAACDLGDEADCMTALMGRGFGPQAIGAHLEAAIDKARSTLAASPFRALEPVNG